MQPTDTDLAQSALDERDRADLRDVGAIVQRATQTRGQGLTARQVLVLARVAEKYAPIEVAPRKLPSIAAAGPTCTGCGTAVSNAGQLCPSCQQRVAAKPRPLFETAPQPEPAYAKGARQNTRSTFADMLPTEEPDTETVNDAE